jgi:ABC-2 type transport system permease protein
MGAVVMAPMPHQRESAIPGLRVMLSLVLRRNAARLLAWSVGLAGLTAMTVAFYKNQFDTPQSLGERAVLSQTGGMRAVFGAVTSTGLGAAVWSELWMFSAVAVGTGMALLLTRDNRADEELGRAELLLSRRVCASAGLAASVIVLTATTAVTTVATTMICAAFGLDLPGTGWQGSLLWGSSVGAVGLVGIGIAALTNQLATTGRGANLSAVGVLAGFYLLRAVGDLKGDGLVWSSPIGWAEKTDPWGADRWWPLALSGTFAAACLCVAFALRSRRDYGAGLIQPRQGHPRAGAFLTTELGLVVRVGRGTAIAWIAGTAAWAALLGSTLTDMTGLTDRLSVLTGGNSLNNVIALWLRITALLTACLLVHAVLTLRGDETRGLIEAHLSGTVSRLRLVGVRLAYAGALTITVLTTAAAIIGLIYGVTVSDPAWAGRLVGASLAQLPSLTVLAGIALFLGGWFPRRCGVTAWAAVSLTWMVAILGNAMGIPPRLLGKLPFASAGLPASSVDWPVAGATAAIGVALIAVGILGYRRRDIPR